jgi:predicted CXXCH cytochrome family protein
MRTLCLKCHRLHTAQLRERLQQKRAPACSVPVKNSL